MGMKEIREPALAGSWYPGNSEILSRDVKRYIGNAKKENVEGQIVALVSPHAGYIYSGQVAAYAYKLVEGMVFDSVVVVGPSHRHPLRARPSGSGGFRTPLGVVPVDTELSKMMEAKGDSVYSRGASQENSLNSKFHSSNRL
jgi:AmmeMemoRadiSam system protein B